MNQITLLRYKEPASPKLVVLEQELVRAEAACLVAEVQLTNITRETLKSAFNYRFDALREHCEKIAIIAGYGKHLLELIDNTPITPGDDTHAYDGQEASKALVFGTQRSMSPLTDIPSIMQDCEDALTNWVESNAAVRSNLSQRARKLYERGTSKNNGKSVYLSGEYQSVGSGASSTWAPTGAHAKYYYGDLSVAENEESQIREPIDDNEEGRG